MEGESHGILLLSAVNHKVVLYSITFCIFTDCIFPMKYVIIIIIAIIIKRGLQSKAGRE